MQMEWRRMGKKLNKLLFLFAASVMLIQCKPGTEQKYQVRTKAPDSIYSKDSIELLVISKHLMKSLILSGIFDDDTQVYMDSIIYSPDLNKLVFWVIEKDSTIHRTEEKIPDMPYCYNGYILYAFRNNVKDTLMVREYSYYGTTSNDTYKQTHDVLFKQSFYYERISNLRSNPELAHNFDDIRFWQEPMWSEMKKEPHWYLGKTGALKIENYKNINGEWIKK